MTNYPKPSDFSAVERAVCTAFASGEQLSLPLPGGKDVRVRAAVLSGLLTGLYRIKQSGVPALRLRHAKVTGRFDLEAVRVEALIELTDCVFDEPLDLRMAHLVGLRLPGCKVPALKGRNLRVDSDLVLEAGFKSYGSVDLTDATVQGTLRLAGAVLHSPQGHALLAARVSISGSLQATALRATGEVRLRGANVGGSVHLGGAHLTNHGGEALEATGLVVSGNLSCDRDGGRFTVQGRVLLSGARIGGDAVFSGARIAVDPDASGTGALDRPAPQEQVLVIPHGSADAGAALVADRIQVDGNIKLDDGFTAHGSVRLPNATVGGYLRLSGATLGREDVLLALAERNELTPAVVPVALVADGIQVGGDLEARGSSPGPAADDESDDGDGHRDAEPPHTDKWNALCAYGQVRLVDANVRGSASLSRVWLYGPGLDVLFADRLQVGGTLFLRRFRAHGSVRLQNAHIGSTLDCSGAVLTSPRRRPDGSLKPSLDARVATIGKDLLCSRGFVADGGVRVRLAEVGKMITFTGARLGEAWNSSQRPNGMAIALNAYGLTAQQLVLRFAVPPVGRVMLTRATVVSVVDDEQVWSASGGIELEDFAFEAITAVPDVDVGVRLRWLRHVLPDFAPGPYDRLAAVYRNAGHEERAERSLLEKQRRRHTELGVAGRLWGWLQEGTVGYGYRPWLAMLWLGVFWLAGALWFDLMYSYHPADYQYLVERLDSDQNPVWNPWLLAADMLLPIINLGQDNMWRVTGASQWITSLLTAVGWILASTAAAGATRVLKRA